MATPSTITWIEVTFADDDCDCPSLPCFCAEVKRDVDWLLENPDESLAHYHKAHYYCQLINALRRRVWTATAAERKRCADYVRSRGIRGRDWVDSQALADELERLES